MGLDNPHKFGSWVVLLAACVLACSESVWAQKASNWRVYRMADGLAEPACVSVTVGPHGRVLVRHLAHSVISQLDGYSVERLPAPEPVTRRIYGSPAGPLWAPAQQGLLEFRNSNWVLHPVPQVTSSFAASPLRWTQIPLMPVRQGFVLFLLPDALMVLYAKDPTEPETEELLNISATRLGRFNSFTLARDGGLWISGSNGIAKVTGPARNLRPNPEWTEYLPPPELGLINFQELNENETGSIQVLAEHVRTGQKYLAFLDRQRWSVERVPVDHARHAFSAANNTFWAVTPSALYQWEPGAQEVSETEEISARHYYDAAWEPSGVFWLATSDGLYRFAPPAWRTPKGLGSIASVVHALTGDRRERVWFATANALHSFENDAHREFVFPPAILGRAPPPQTLACLRDGSVMFEIGGNLHTLDPARGDFQGVGDTNKNWRILGMSKDGTACVHGIAPGQPSGPGELAFFDGVRFEPLMNPPLDPSLGNKYLTFFSAQNGDLWLGTDAATAWYHDGKWEVFEPGPRGAPEGASSFVELGDGRILCASQDHLWEFNGRSWKELPRVFDRIHSLLRARDGSVWVASNTGCYRFAQGTWVENGIEEGLPAAGIREVYEDSRGRVWAGTTHGLSIYHPEADSDPPKAFIIELRDKRRDIPEGASVNLAFNGVDKWKFTARHRLLYSYRLDQRDWTEFSEETHAVFADLPAGQHYFQLRAMDRNCNIDTRPERLEFAIVLPWFKETRLLIIAVMGGLVALFFAGIAFNRHRQLVRSYAEVELKVTERTRELEVANRQLLHSQKMTALGTLAAGIAHDFNNILSIVKGSAQIIEQNVENPGKIQTRVERIKTVVEQGSGIVKAMLGFSRDSQQSAVSDINSVVDDTIRLLGDRFLREVKVVFRPAPEMPQFRVAKDLVQQILLNYIFNAAEAMAEQKQIFIVTRMVDHLPDDLVLAPARAAAYVEIAVRDTGSGISPEVLPRIFEPFFTTKAFSARRGTGLGLSMVYELARKIQAGLQVETRPGQGSTFSVILPVRDEPEPENPPES